MFNNRLNKFWLIIPFLLFFVLPSSGEAATCIVTSAKWSKNVVKVAENIQMIITVQNASYFNNQNIGLQVFESDFSSAEDPIAGLFIKKFTGTSTTATYDYVFTVQDWEKGGSENPETIYFTALPQNQSDYTKSNAIFLYPAQAGNGGTTITNFNVTQLNASTIRFTFSVSIPRPAELKSFCGADPFWAAREINPIKLVRNGQFALTGTSYKFDFDESGQVANKTYEGVIVCASTQIAKSQPISCNSQGICQSGAGTGCGTPGQPACRPGASQSFSFEIPNPLKGGATDFAGLVKVIAQWLFNLAIPIAVAMIVYAGILFLTSQGDPGKITKARQVLTYAVIGLAIILIGSGFITLIQSILELGGTSTQQNYSCSNNSCVVDSNGTFTESTCNSSCGTTTTAGAIGNKCSRDRDCLSDLKCGSGNICQRPDGNLVGEWCIAGANCAQGLACDKTSDNVRVIDGQTVGKCYQP